MDLHALLPKQHVLLHLDGPDRRAILTALVRPLAAAGLVTDAERFLADLEHRETEVTTQVDPEVALPHARSNAVRRLCLAVGIADAPGLCYNADVSRCCRVFFLIGVPAMAPTAHLPLLQFLAVLVNDPKRRARLFASDTPAKLIRSLVAPKG